MILNADALTALRTLPDASAQTCVTSPPYYALRDYANDGQIGLEDSPDDYVARLVEIFREVRRVLKNDGTLWVVIGDSYANDDKWGGATGGKHRSSLHGKTGVGRTKRHTGLPPKNLIGIPWMLAFALRADGWYLRQDIIWAKPNPMPESVRDRCTKAHEYIFLLSKSRRYYYNHEAVKEQAVSSSLKKYIDGRRDKRPGRMRRDSGFSGRYAQMIRRGGVPRTRNRRSVWTVATRPYVGTHFATFPPELIRPCILAGSRPGDVVLDPFFGAGTTGVVAVEEGRQYIGIDINAEYCELARKRIANAAQQLNVFDAGEIQQ